MISRPANIYRDHGLLDMVTHRKDLRETLGRLIGLLCEGKKAA